MGPNMIYPRSMITSTNTTEERIKRFQRLAARRTQRVLHRLDVLGNCSNKSNYVYSPEQVEKIFKTLRDKVNEIEMRFKAKKSADFQL